MKKLIGSVVVLAALLVAGQAQAISRHERVAVKPIKAGGQVVGFKLKMVLHSANFNVARVGLGKSSVREAIQPWDPGRMRALVEKEEKSYLRLKLDEVTGLQEGRPHELELEVHYGKGNDLKSGEKVDVFTSWRRDADKGYQHFFGVFVGSDHQTTSVELP